LYFAKIISSVPVTVSYTVRFLKYDQQDAKFSRFIYFYKLIYIFQVVPPPIIRSTICIYSVRYTNKE